jgi:hypothetical protein
MHFRDNIVCTFTSYLLCSLTETEKTVISFAFEQYFFSYIFSPRRKIDCNYMDNFFLGALNLFTCFAVNTLQLRNSRSTVTNPEVHANKETKW